MARYSLNTCLLIGLGFGFPSLSFAESRWISLRTDLLAVPFLFGGPLGGPTYFMSYLMLEDMGGWSFGLMNRYTSLIRSTADEEELLSPEVEWVGVGVAHYNYKQLEYGIRVERKLPFLNPNLYIATEVYRSRMDFDIAKTYQNKAEQKCYWRETGHSSFNARNIMVGYEWRVQVLSIWSELGYKVAQITTKPSDSTIYNPCGETQERPKPDPDNVSELDKSKWFIGINAGFNF